MKFSVVALGALALVGTASANVPCNADCAKMKCFPTLCSQKGYTVVKTEYFTITTTPKGAGSAETVTVTADDKDAGGKDAGEKDAGGKTQPTVTKTCTVTSTAAPGGKDAEKDDKETVTKTVTVEKDAGGKGGEVKTVTVTAAVEDDEPETVTKVTTKTCTKTVTQTVTVEGSSADAGGYY
ncbi:uncharacterized protein DFL_008700 [Arthrobotrys flagrans]|uniref:Uncharacterized protein n=1 Tax=Arthrobotrys flagrans TaxID=97331 RepID=A0A436ZPJ0_ARTFL|nr:hypothetical protein DFL_008700 [Arthrobotrys flagrans]